MSRRRKPKGQDPAPIATTKWWVDVVCRGRGAHEVWKLDEYTVEFVPVELRPRYPRSTRQATGFINGEAIAWNGTLDSGNAVTFNYRCPRCGRNPQVTPKLMTQVENVLLPAWNHTTHRGEIDISLRGLPF